MLGTIPVSDALTLLSNEVLMRGLGDSFTVGDALPTKRASAHYPHLLDSVRKHGITTPVHIRTSRHGRFLVEGHHRITAAHDAGLTFVPWTDDAILADRIEHMPWQLTPGTITPSAVQAFTRDASASLALALHDTTGWPLIEVGYSYGQPLHFMVRRPDHLLIDIRGAHTDAAITDQYEYDADDTVTFNQVSRASVWRCYLGDCAEPVPMELARTFAPTVLDGLPE